MLLEDDERFLIRCVALEQLRPVFIDTTKLSIKLWGIPLYSSRNARSERITEGIDLVEMHHRHVFQTWSIGFNKSLQHAWHSIRCNVSVSKMFCRSWVLWGHTLTYIKEKDSQMVVAWCVMWDLVIHSHTFGPSWGPSW